MIGCPLISIVIPALNEERTLGTTFPALFQFLRSKGWRFEVVLVDDGSSDQTAFLTRTFAQTSPELRLLQHTQTSGKGWAIRTGMLAAKGEFVVFMDADLSYDLNSLERIVEELRRGAGVVVGSRRLPESKVLQAPPLRRRVASYLFKSLVQLLFSLPTTDTQCGLKGFRRDVVLQLFSRQSCHTFAFDVEILSWAKRLKIPMLVIPVTLKGSDSSSVRIATHSAGVLLDLIRIWWDMIRTPSDETA